MKKGVPRMEIAAIVFLLALLMTGIFAAFPRQDLYDSPLADPDTAAAAVDGGKYVAYIDYSNLIAKVVLVDVESHSSRVVSDVSFDAYGLKSERGWLMWTEENERTRRVVWYNLSTGAYIMREVAKDGQVMYSISSSPALSMIDDGNAMLWILDNGGEWRRVSSSRIGSYDYAVLYGMRLFYSRNESVYLMGNDTPQAVFPDNVQEFAVANGVVFALLHDDDNSSLYAYYNGTANLISTYDGSLKWLRAGTLDNGTIISVINNIGKHSGRVVILSWSEGSVLWERHLGMEGMGIRAQDMSLDGDVLIAYLATSGDEWVLHADFLSLDGTVLERNAVMSSATPYGYVFNLILVMPAMFLFIFGMIPNLLNKRRAMADGIVTPARRFISYEPYPLFKAIFIVAGTLSAVLAFASVLYMFPDRAHRCFIPLSFSLLSIFYGASYLLVFRREFRASPQHAAAYFISIALLAGGAFSMYHILSGSWVQVMNTLLLLSGFELVGMVFISALTFWGLVAHKNGVLLVIAILLFSAPMLISVPYVGATDFYPSVGWVYSMMGELILVGMFLGILHLMFGISVVSIARESFIPVSKWSVDDYLDLAFSMHALAQLANAFLLLVVMGFLFTISSDSSTFLFGLLSLGFDDSTLMPMVGVIGGMSIFLGFIGWKATSSALKNTERLFTKPTKVIGSALWSSLSMSMGGLTFGLFFGISSLAFFVAASYISYRAYGVLRDKIVEGYGSRAVEEVEEGELKDVPISRDLAKKYIVNTSKSEVKMVIGISLMMVFLWKFITDLHASFSPGGAWSFLDSLLLVLALLPLISPFLLRKAMQVKGDFYTLMSKTSWCDMPIAIGIVNIVLAAMLSSPPQVALISLATSLFALLAVYRIRTRELVKRIDEMGDEDLKVPEPMLKIMLYYANQGRGEIFKTTGYTAPPVGGSLEPQGIPVESSPGELLSVEPEEYRRRRVKTIRNVGISIFLLLSIFYFSLCLLFGAANILIFGLGYVAIVGGMFAYIMKIRRGKVPPIKVYENGVEFSNYLGIVAFFRYDGFSGKVLNTRRGKALVFTRKQALGARAVMSFPVWPELETHLDAILSRMKEELPHRMAVEIRDVEKYNRAYSRVFIGSYLAVTAVALLFSIPFFIFGGLGYLMASMGAAYAFRAGVRVSSSTASRVFGRKPEIDRRYVVIPILVVTLLLVAGYVAPVNISEDYSASRDMGEYQMIAADISNATLNINSSIAFSGKVTVENAILNVTESGVGIYILENSSVTFRNVTIRGEPWIFESYGSLLAVNSTFVSPLGDKKHENWQGGMEIYGDAEFRGCIFENATTNHIMAFRSRVTVEDSTFVHSGDEGIEGTYSEVFVRNTTFFDVKWGITVFQSSLHVDSATFQNCSHGVTLADSSSGEIRSVSFENCGTAITIDTGSTATISSVSYRNVEHRVVDNSRELNMTCLPIVVLMDAVLLGIGFAGLKKR